MALGRRRRSPSSRDRIPGGCGNPGCYRRLSVSWPSRAPKAVPWASKRHGFCGTRYARGKLLQRVAEVGWVCGELLQRLLRVQTFKLDNFPLGLVDLAQSIIALEVGREHTEYDAVGHD